MEKKQLNFNAPLLSVRKSGPILRPSEKVNKKSNPTRQHSLPIKNSEWELGEVTKPAAVPFLWEQIPGRPKGEGDGRTESPKRSSSAPRLPPGRVTDVRRNSGERPSDQNTYKFQWRNSGERANDQNMYKSQWHNSGERPIDQNIYKTQSEVYPLNDHAALVESLRESIYANGESDLESIDDAYSDALDALSRAESLSLNCSVSGLSGSEVPNVKPSGTFLVDQQTRDFMMSRFLPAAKAVVVEIPQYIPRKQSKSAEQTKLPLVADHTKQVKRVTADEKKPLLDQSRSNIFLSNTRYIEDAKSEADDNEHDNHGNDSGIRRGKLLGKAWGFFPRLCVKKSLCLLNPVPAMKPKTQVPKSPSIDVSRFTRKAYSGPLEKPTWDPSNKKRFHSGVLSRELHHVDTRVSETNQLSYSSASYRAGGLSPCRPFRSGGISPYRSSRPQSPFSKGASFLGMPREVDSHTRSQSPFSKGASFLGMPKEVENLTRSQSPFSKERGFLSMPKEVESLTRSKSPFSKKASVLHMPKEVENLARPQSPFGKGARFLGMPKPVENLTTQKYSLNDMKCSNSLDAPAPRIYKKEAVSSSNVAEKTLYIDSVNSVYPVQDSTTTLEDPKLVNSSSGNLQTLARNRRKENFPNNSYSEEALSLDVINGGTNAAESKSSPLQDKVLASAACIPKVRGTVDGHEDSKMDQCVNQESRMDYNNNQPEEQTNPSADSLQSPQPPPLPKSPSESWLWRTVPSIHLHNPFSLLQRGNHYQSKKLSQNASATGTTWETIVKTSNVHYDLGRYTEEPNPHIAHKQDRR